MYSLYLCVGCVFTFTQNYSSSLPWHLSQVVVVMVVVPSAHAALSQFSQFTKLGAFPKD